MADRPTASDPTPPAVLTEAQDQFISIWGRMGSSWGIPCTMAEVHALLFIVGEPLSADAVMERLRISRGNASMTLRALVDWGIVERVRLRGERKDYFQAEQDVWKLFRTILRERKKREIDPVLDALNACRAMTDPPPSRRRRVRPEDAPVVAHNQRLDDMLEFMEMIESLSERFVSPSGKGLRMAAKLLARVS